MIIGLFFWFSYCRARKADADSPVGKGFLVSFLGFKVWSFMVSCFFGFLVSKFQGFTKTHFLFFFRYWSHIRDFQDFLRRIGVFVWRPPSRKLSRFLIPVILRFTKLLFVLISQGFLLILGILVFQKINNIGFGAQGHVQKSRNRKMRSFGFSHKQIEKI